MKKIKFRIYDSRGKTMIYFEFRNIYQVGKVGDFAYISRTISVRDSNEDNSVPLCIDCDDRQDHEVMQFTGLSDKNGKEIYEGDIFDCPYTDETKNHHKWKIIWGEISGGFILQRIGNPCNQIQVHQSVSDMTRRKILGNIYENPKLLK